MRFTRSDLYRALLMYLGNYAETRLSMACLNRMLWQVIIPAALYTVNQDQQILCTHICLQATWAYEGIHPASRLYIEKDTVLWFWDWPDGAFISLLSPAGYNQDSLLFWRIFKKRRRFYPWCSLGRYGEGYAFVLCSQHGNDQRGHENDSEEYMREAWSSLSRSSLRLLS